MDRRQLQAAALEYPYLRGLFSIPVGLLCIVAALGNWAWGPFAHAWVFVAALLVVALICAAINRYYNERYGRVTPSARQQAKAAAAGALSVTLMIGLTTLLRSRASWSLDLPVNPIAAAFAALMLAYYALVIGLKPHHVVIWGSLLVAGLLPVWDGGDPGNVGLVLSGIALVLSGALDHLLLVRTFATPALDPGNAGG
jgi:hypothetical protein